MRYAILLLAFDCSSGTCPTLIAQQVSGGAGTVVDASTTMNASAFTFLSSGSGEASFSFDFGDASNATLSCSSIPWSNLAKSLVAVSDSCTLGIESFVDSIAVTITAAQTQPDAQGSATVTITVDLPSTDLVAVDTNTNATHAVQLQLDALAGTATFAQQSCGSGCTSENVYGGTL